MLTKESVDSDCISVNYLEMVSAVKGQHRNISISLGSVTSRYHGSTKPTTTATARRTAKNNMFILTNNNFARASRYFVHFFSFIAHYHLKLPNFASPLGVGEHNTKIVAFFFYT